MGLALLVYALAEEELRRTLKALKESLPNQKRKPTSRPTMRWIFQLMDGIYWIPARGDPKGTVWMKDVQKKIVSFFSLEVKAIYGVSIENGLKGIFQKILDSGKIVHALKEKC